MGVLGEIMFGCGSTTTTGGEEEGKGRWTGIFDEGSIKGTGV